MSALAGLIAAAGFEADLPVSIAVVDRASQFESAAAGRWPGGLPVATGDRFYGASLAKQFTGAAAAALVREGRLDPDASIGIWLPALPAWLGQVTARQLAHHMAGLPAAGIAEEALGQNWTEASVSGYLTTLGAPTYPAGTAHRYSNLGYILLARLVAAVSDMAFTDFVATQLTDSAEIDFTSNFEMFPQAPLLNFPPLTHGDGGLWTNSRAFAGWLDQQNRDPLQIAAITEAPGRLNDGTAIDYGWGLGLRTYRGARLLIHGGAWKGAACKAMRCPALGLAAVVLTAGGDMEKVVALADAALDYAATPLRPLP